MTYLTHKLALASALSVLALAAVPVASAHESDAGLGLHLGTALHLGDKHDSDKEDKNSRDDGDKDARAAVAGTVSAISTTTVTLAGNDGVTYTLNVTGVKGGSASDIKVGDSVVAQGSVNGTTVASANVIDLTFLRALASDRRSHVRAGIVTAVNGSSFTIESLGTNPKTTVTTDASTIIKADGKATSSAITVGSRVFVLGTTTATSSTGDTFAASLVKILGKGLGHLKFWLWFH